MIHKSLIVFHLLSEWGCNLIDQFHQKLMKLCLFRRETCICDRFLKCSFHLRRELVPERRQRRLTCRETWRGISSCSKCLMCTSNSFLFTEVVSGACVPALIWSDLCYFILIFFTVPTPAIIFLCVIAGVIIILFIIYQVVKRGLVCNLEPPERPDDDDYEQLHKTVPYETETDDDYLGPSSKTTSRRSSYNTSGSLRSDGDLPLGDSVSLYCYGNTDGMEYPSYSPTAARRALSAYGETPNRGVDIRVQGPGEELVSTAGRLQISASYAPTADKLAVSILRAEDLPTKERGGASTVQVRVVLLPGKKQRFKTKLKPSDNPGFHETFTFSRVTQEEIRFGSLRMRVYGHEKFGRDRLVGELNMPLSEFDLDSEADTVWKTIIPRSQLSVNISYCFLTSTVSFFFFFCPSFSFSFTFSSLLLASVSLPSHPIFPPLSFTPFLSHPFSHTPFSHTPPSLLFSPYSFNLSSNMFYFPMPQGADSLYDLSDSTSLGSGYGGSASSLVAAHGGAPELLVSLCYQSLTGRLTVEILKASNLRMPSMQRAPGTVLLDFIVFLYLIVLFHFI